MNFLDAIWLIPLFPLLGAVVMLVLGRRLDPQPVSPDALSDELAAEVAAAGEAAGESEHGHGHHFAASRKWISLFCPGMVLLSLIFSIGAVAQLAVSPEKVHEVIKYTWLTGGLFHLNDGTLGRFAADMGFLLDPLSGVMILVVTFVGFLIHVYSIGYMGHESGYYRFFGYLNLFVFFMLREFLADLGSWYLMLLGAVAVVIMLKAPQGLWGLVVERFDLHFFPVRRRLIVTPPAERSRMV